MIVINFIQILFNNLVHFRIYRYFPTYKDKDNIFIIIIINNLFGDKNSWCTFGYISSNYLDYSCYSDYSCYLYYSDY